MVDWIEALLFGANIAIAAGLASVIIKRFHNKSAVLDPRLHFKQSLGEKMEELAKIPEFQAEWKSFVNASIFMRSLC